MKHRNLIIDHVTIVTPMGHKARSGREMEELLTIPDGVIVATEGRIEYAGERSKAPRIDTDRHEYMDGHGHVALPGFVDSHTHLIFGGYRPEEFEWRLKGDTYMSIMERGGGIQSTVNATRSESEESLVKKAKWFLDAMSAMGVTTVEAKSGYGLNPATEFKQLRAINCLATSPDRKLDICSTFLGAHAVPSEYSGRTAQYVDHIISDMLPQARGLAEFCDIFTEKNVFEIEDSRRLLMAAKEMGFKLKLHADEIVTLGGAELAAEVGAVSADHLLHISDEGVKTLAGAGVVATLLPLTAFALKEPYAPARKLIDAGAAVALATDLNPGSCFSGSIPLTIALACIYMGMSIAETVTALTLNGAAALDRADSIGSLEAGKQADVTILNFDTVSALPYYVGMNCVKAVVSRGKLVTVNP